MKKYPLLMLIVMGSLFFSFASCSGVSMLNDYPGKSLSEAIDNTDLSLLEYAPPIKQAVNDHVKTAGQLASFRAFAADMIEKTKADDPDFYNDFKEKINSNDPELRNEAFKAGVEKLAEQFKDYCCDDELSQDQIFEKIFNDY